MDKYHAYAAYGERNEACAVGGRDRGVRQRSLRTTSYKLCGLTNWSW